MHDDNSDFESFEEMVRTFARELGRSAERITQFDVDGLAETVGIDPDRARAWAETAGKWLRGQVTPDAAAGSGYRVPTPGAPVLPPVDPEHGADPSKPDVVLRPPAPDVLTAILATWRVDRRLATS